MRQNQQYRETFIGFLEDKKTFSSYNYFTPQPENTFMNADEIVRKRTGGEFQTLEALDAWREAQNDWRSYFQNGGSTYIDMGSCWTDA